MRTRRALLTFLLRQRLPSADVPLILPLILQVQGYKSIMNGWELLMNIGLIQVRERPFIPAIGCRGLVEILRRDLLVLSSHSNGQVVNGALQC